MRKYVNALKCIYFDAYVRSNIRQRPTLYKTGRVRGTREIVVRPNYVMVYRIEEDGGTLAVLRVLHAAQQWPSGEERNRKL
jgi:plasmid stabilization system protein ParE